MAWGFVAPQHRSLRICSFVAPRPRPFWAQRNTSDLRDTTLALSERHRPAEPNESLRGWGPAGPNPLNLGRPFGTWFTWHCVPNVKTLGYCRLSLRDKTTNMYLYGYDSPARNQWPCRSEATNGRTRLSALQSSKDLSANTPASNASGPGPFLLPSSWTTDLLESALSRSCGGTGP